MFVKKLSIFLLCLTLLLSGCQTGFNQSKCISQLQRAGFKITLHGDSGGILEEASASINDQIAFYGGSFTVEVVAFTNLRKTDGKDHVSCQFNTFATADQAQQYYKLLLEVRSQYYAVSLQDRVVVFTNSKEAVDILGLAFA